MAEGKDDVNKNDPTKSMSNQNKGSGSDTASAAKISAGTSVGNVGSSPKPQSAAGQGSTGQGSTGQGSAGQGSAGAGASGMGSGAGASGASSGSGSGAGASGASSGTGASGGSSGGSSGMGSGAGASGAQSSTLASHTSRPLGGQGGGTQAGATGANLHGASSQKPAGAQGSSAGSGQQASGNPSKGTAEQVQEKASEALEQATDWARDTYERASNWASDAYEHGTRRAGRYGQGYGGARSVQNYVAQNPVMVGLVGLAAGLIIGALLPRTRREDETFGEWADEVRSQGMRYAHDMTERGREYVEQAFSGDDPRFSKHESEFNASQRGQGTARQ